MPSSLTKDTLVYRVRADVVAIRDPRGNTLHHDELCSNAQGRVAESLQTAHVYYSHSQTL